MTSANNDAYTVLNAEIRILSLTQTIVFHENAIFLKVCAYLTFEIYNYDTFNKALDRWKKTLRWLLFDPY